MSDKLIKFYIFLFIAALFVGALYIAPQILIQRNLQADGETYLFLQFGDEINQYMARAREVYDGHFLPSDLTFDAKPTVFNPIPPLIFAPFIYLFSGNIQSAYFVVIFVFSSIIFLLFYLISWKILENRSWATCLALIAVLTTLARNLPYVFFNANNFINVFLKNFYPLVKTPIDRLPLTRFDDPLLTLPFYLTAILFLFLFWKNPKKSLATLAGVFSGLLFYTYFHNWTYVIVIIGTLFLFAILERKNEPKRLGLFFLILGIVGLASVPYFINYFLFQNLPESQDYIARTGAVMSRLDINVYKYYIVYFIAALLVWRLFLKKDRQKALFFFASIISLFLILNVQVITGFTIDPERWLRAAGLIFFLIVFNILIQVFRDRGKLKIATAILIIATTLLVGKKIVNDSLFLYPPAEILPYYKFDPKIIESWDWINAHLPKEPRIISSSYVTSDFLTSYTSARPYMPTGSAAIATNYLLEQRFLEANAVFHIPADSLRLRITAEPLGPNWKKPELLHNLNLGNTQGYLYTNFYSSFGYKIPQSKIDELMSRYNYTNPSLRSIEADYIYYGLFEKELSSPDFSSDSRLERIFNNSVVEIYRIKK